MEQKSLAAAAEKVAQSSMIAPHSQEAIMSFCSRSSRQPLPMIVQDIVKRDPSLQQCRYHCVDGAARVVLELGRIPSGDAERGHCMPRHSCLRMQERLPQRVVVPLLLEDPSHNKTLNSLRNKSMLGSVQVWICWVGLKM